MIRHIKFSLPSVVVLVVGGSIAEAYGRWFLSLILTVGAFLAIVVSLSPPHKRDADQRASNSTLTANDSETPAGESKSEG